MRLFSFSNTSLIAGFVVWNLLDMVTPSSAPRVEQTNP
jgi:hypothetical protein